MVVTSPSTSTQASNLGLLVVAVLVLACFSVQPVSANTENLIFDPTNLLLPPSSGTAAVASRARAGAAHHQQGHARLSLGSPKRFSVALKGTDDVVDSSYVLESVVTSAQDLPWLDRWMLHHVATAAPYGLIKARVKVCWPASVSACSCVRVFPPLTIPFVS